MSLNIEYAAIAQCRPEHVWQVFEQIELWPRWAPQAISDVRWVSGEPWTTGAKFSIQMLKPISFKLTPEVLAVESPFYIHLCGNGSGVSGDQHYIFKWMPNEQTTELRTLQEFSGGPIMFFGDSVKPAIEAGIRHMFARVIAEAEILAQGQLPAAPLAEFAAPELIDSAPQAGNPPAPVGGPAPHSDVPEGRDPASLSRDPEPPADHPAPPIGDLQPLTDEY